MYGKGEGDRLAQCTASTRRLSHGRMNAECIVELVEMQNSSEDTSTGEGDMPVQV